ncbi:MAG: peptidylprolyl isomerase [Micrococcaceae bacterium]
MDKKMKQNVIAGSIIGALVLGGAGTYFYTNSSSIGGSSTSVPSKKIAENKELKGTMVTNLGTISMTMDGKKAPQGVSVFKDLADKKFFNGTKCHRLVTESIYILQCGDPNGDGTGGPSFEWGPVENAPANNQYKAGDIAVARHANDANSQGSQFFIVYKDSKIPADSAGGYSVIGKVTSGLDLIQKAAKQGTKDGSNDGTPKQEVKIDNFQLTQ